MDLNDIATFVRVVEAGSFTGAARLLKQPKTTVSRRVAHLEETLGARLLHRTTRSLSLTDAGRRYYEECAAALAAFEDANQRMSEAQLAPSGLIRISAPANAGSFGLAGMVADFLARYPRVSIELVLTDEALNLVAERIDVALRSGQLADSTLMARKLRSNHRVLCASPAYLGKNGVPRRPDDLRRHDCIIFGPSLEGTTWTLEGPGGSELIPVTGRVAVNTMHFALEAAVAGLGIAQLPRAFAESEIGNGRLTVVLERYSTAKGGFYAVYPSARHLSVAVKAFIDFAAERFAERPEPPAALVGETRGWPPRSRRAAVRAPAPPS